MHQSVADLENRRLSAIAREYEKNGYRVVRRPSKADLPDFLSAFAPDLIAYSAGDNVVVEVKSKPTLPESGYLPALSEVVSAKPNWRLELVVTNNRYTRLLDAAAEELDEEGIRERIAHVHYLLRIEQDEAAALLAWSAAEAMLRVVARREGIGIEHSQAAFAVKKLYSLGILDDEEYGVFQEALRLRNVIMHGFQPSVQPGDAIRRVVSTVEELLQADSSRRSIA